MRAVDLDIEQLRKRLHHDVKGARQQQHVMARALVLANAAHTLGIHASQRDRVQRLASQPPHDLVVETVVLAIEGALKFSARAALQVEPSRGLAQHLGHERGPILERLRAQAHPQEIFDDVRLHQRAVDVEHRQHIGPPGAPLDRRPHRIT